MKLSHLRQGNLQNIVFFQIDFNSDRIFFDISQNCLAKSANKHNRLYVSAAPLDNGLVEKIDNGQIGASDDPQVRGKKLVQEFKWDATESRKIWAFGPDGNGPNMLVDCTKSIQYLTEIKDFVVSGFNWVTHEGVLAGEGMRGVRFNLMDVLIHSDRMMRGANQMIPAARRVLLAAQMTAQPRLMEPIFLVEIQAPQSVVGTIYSLLNRKRGVIIEEIPRPGTPLLTLKAHLPVAESFGFTSDLRQATSGQAFPQCVFDHWSILSGDPFEEGKVKELVESIRKRKSLSPSIPPLSNYLDKL